MPLYPLLLQERLSVTLPEELRNRLVRYLEPWGCLTLSQLKLLGLGFRVS